MQIAPKVVGRGSEGKHNFPKHYQQNNEIESKLTYDVLNSTTTRNQGVFEKLQRIMEARRIKNSFA